MKKKLYKKNRTKRTEQELRDAAFRLIHTAPADLEEITESLTATERHQLADALQHIARYAGFAGMYLEERHGYGCGDQGHRKAVTVGNRAMKKIWMQAFGFNACFPYNI